MHDVTRRTPVQFFALVYLLTIPFLVLGALTGVQLLPGLPLAALAAIGPVTAALILLFKQGGGGAAAGLLARAFDFARAPARLWFVPIALIPIAVAVVCFLCLRWQGVAVPLPVVSTETALSLSALFFVAALCEELGWSGYALDPLQARFGALGAGLVLGVLWALWHYIPLLQAGRGVDYIAWWSLGTVSRRVVMVWLYNNSGRSVFGMAVFHAVSNLAWQLFPVEGSFYDPKLLGLTMAALAAFAVIAWGPATLAGRSTPLPAGDGLSSKKLSRTIGT